MALERKYERDIDIFLAEEFSVSPLFASWFLKQTLHFKDVSGTVTHVFVSKSDNTGESDLVVIYRIHTSEEHIALLIEDKIDAPFQPDQCKRYRLRAEQEIKKSEKADYSRAEVVLCAPEAYLGVHVEEANDFDCRVSYERIAEFLRQESDRASYRSKFIQTAASRSISSYQPHYDEQTNEFWSRVYRLATDDFPSLGMRQTRFTTGTTWIAFRPYGMPTQPRLVNVNLKGGLGIVDLTFSRTSNASFQPLIRALLEEDMTSHQTGASASIRLTTLPFKTSEPIQDALAKARVSLDAAVRLVRLYFLHQDALLDAANQSPLAGS